ncbi:MAG: DUF433 domain-containing protein [Opitutus sp.]|nr:DUF433 domain-containing protein [Opitutus sp.]
MPSPIDIGSLITRSPEIKGGRPRIHGTGVTVQRIAGWYKLGLDAEEIAQQVGHITVGDVHAALAYYHANTLEIEGLLAQEAADYRRLAIEFPRTAPMAR